ncbi:MAG: 50S ribosomal protein L9 [Minisyncoccia bacterium]
MKVILLKDVRNVGHKDDVKDVADGFAENFLLPQNLAVVATETKIAALEKNRAEAEARAEAETRGRESSIRELSGARVELSARATKTGGLFKTIGANAIVRAIKEQKGIDLPEDSVDISAAIKTTGGHPAVLHASKARSEITVVVTAV